MRKTIMAGVFAGVMATSAQANVIYNFQADPGSAKQPYAQITGGRMTITDAAYQAGAADFEFDPYGGGSVDWADNPVVSMTLGIDPVSFGVEPGDPDFRFRSHPFSAHLSFNPNGTLDGAMHVRDDSDEADLAGSGDNWRVFNYNSDYFVLPKYGCAGDRNCDIGTGYWQLDASTVPGDPAADVPAPSAWVLFGVAVLGLFGATRRRMTG